jgi:hypothetical protein
LKIVIIIFEFDKKSAMSINLPRYLPSAEELPDSDETPADKKLQQLIPGLLKAILLI